MATEPRVLQVLADTDDSVATRRGLTLHATLADAGLEVRTVALAPGGRGEHAACPLDLLRRRAVGGAHDRHLVGVDAGGAGEAERGRVGRLLGQSTVVVDVEVNRVDHRRSVRGGGEGHARPRVRHHRAVAAIGSPA